MTDTPELKFSPEVFDPKKAELQAIAAEVALITADPEKMTKEDLELINTTKNKLVKARTTIEKAGKALRESANKFNKDVIAYEDELIAIIEPEEKRLKDIETAAKEYAMREERKKTLPEFRAKLDSIGDGIVATDEELLALDPNERDAYYNGRLGVKLEADRVADEARRAEEDAARAAEQKKLDDEREKIEAEKKLAEEREWSARTSRILGMGFRDAGNNFEFGIDIVISKTEARMLQTGAFEAMIEDVAPRVEQKKKQLAEEAEAKRQAEIKEAADKATKEAEAAAAKKAADEKAAADQKAAEEKAAAEARSKAAAYEAFLKDNAYNPETDITQHVADLNTTILYRRVASYKHEQ